MSVPWSHLNIYNNLFSGIRVWATHSFIKLFIVFSPRVNGPTVLPREFVVDKNVYFMKLLLFFVRRKRIYYAGSIPISSCNFDIFKSLHALENYILNHSVWEKEKERAVKMWATKIYTRVPFTVNCEHWWLIAFFYLEQQKSEKICLICFSKEKSH